MSKKRYAVVATGSMAPSSVTVGAKVPVHHPLGGFNLVNDVITSPPSFRTFPTKAAASRYASKGVGLCAVAKKKPGKGWVVVKTWDEPDQTDQTDQTDEPGQPEYLDHQYEMQTLFGA